MEEQLKPLVEKALQVAETTGEFAIEHAPELLRQFYTWRAVINSIGILISILLIYFAILIAKYYGKRKPEIHENFKFLGRWYDSTTENFGAGAALFSIVIITNIIIAIIAIIGLLKLIIAPKLYLIEKFL